MKGWQQNNRQHRSREFVVHTSVTHRIVGEVSFSSPYLHVDDLLEAFYKKVSVLSLRAKEERGDALMRSIGFIVRR